MNAVYDFEQLDVSYVKPRTGEWV